jgi:ribosomal protein S18 acetylase RimI-like enzyme
VSEANAQRGGAERSSSGLQHRVATGDDLDLLAAWNRQLNEDERAANLLGVDALRERMRGFLAAEYTAVIFEEDGAPVGYALFRPDENGVYLRQLFVDRAQRRRGIGRRILERLHAEVFPRGVRVTIEVLVHNDRAIAFWRAAGFTDHAIAMTRPT